MSTISAINSASQGIQQNLRMLDNAAARIAKEPLGDNLAATLVDLKVAQHGVTVNAKVLATADRMYQSLIDILA